MADVKAELERLLVPGAVLTGAPASTAPPQPAEIDTLSEKPIAAGGSEWKIEFTPEPTIMMTGNDPLRYIEELMELGEVEVECKTDNFPSFEDGLNETIDNLTFIYDSLMNMATHSIKFEIGTEESIRRFETTVPSD